MEFDFDTSWHTANYQRLLILAKDGKIDTEEMHEWSAGLLEFVDIMMRSLDENDEHGLGQHLRDIGLGGSQTGWHS